jgi:nucleolar pre-ribosomal-associated protein 1
MNDEDDGDLAIEDATEYASEWGLDPWDVLEWKGRIRNTIFGDFLQTLKPWASPKQQQLALAIFKASPELVADYFGRKEAFNYDPKLTATWMGYSSFLYETIELPVPVHLGGGRSHQDFPPPVLTTVQSILPQPLSQQVLTKCLNSNSDLVNFFAVRILVVAFHKLRSVLREFESASSSHNSKVWEQGAARLTAEFCRRCPSMKAVVLASKRPEFQKDMMREAITRLIRLYFEVTPQVALREKFDASVPLCNALTRAEKPTEAPEDKAFHIMEVEHWIRIARYTRSMRWWQKNKTLTYSPFVTLLRLVATSSEGDLSTGITSLLAAILRDDDILQMRTSPNALDALIASITSTCGSSTPSPQVLEFLDDCCARFIRKPIKYIDDLDTMRRKTDPPSECNATPLSPLLMALIEQWPFKGGKSEKGNVADPIAQWLSKLLYLLKLIGEENQLLELVRDSLVSSADSAYQQVLKDSFLWKMGKQKAKEALKLATGADFSGSERSSTSPVPPPEQVMDPPNDPYHGIDLELPPEEDERHPGLNRWKKKDIEEAIEEGDVGELILCLCSKHSEIRIQAVSNIRQLMSNIEVSHNFANVRADC